VALTALLGQIGTPGGGLGWLRLDQPGGGRPSRLFRPAFAPGRNPVEGKIPVARFSDMLLHPGEPYEFDGQTHFTPIFALSTGRAAMSFITIRI
jgi:biotin/methionine sulfoxide reductase